MTIPPSILLRMIIFFQTEVVKNQKRIFSITFSETLVGHARWIAMATNTRLEYVVLSAFPRQ